MVAAESSGSPTGFGWTRHLYHEMIYLLPMHRLRRMRTKKPAIDYETLAELRYQVRRFLRVRELAAQAAGVAPQQYLVLLQIRGATGRQPVTIGFLAERLQIHHHAAVQLIDRMAQPGLVARRRDERDRRAVVVELRPRGESLLRKLAQYSIAELKSEGPALASSLRRLMMTAGRRSRESTNGLPARPRRTETGRSGTVQPGGV